MKRQLTNDEIQKALQSTRLPRKYRTEEFTITKLAETSEQAQRVKVACMEFSQSLILEVEGTDKTSTEVLFAAVRMLTLKGYKGVLLQASRLIEPDNKADLYNEWWNSTDINPRHDFVVIEGLIEGAERYCSVQDSLRLEIFVRNLLYNSVSVIFSGEKLLRDSTMFSVGFKNYVMSQNEFISVTSDKYIAGGRAI